MLRAEITLKTQQAYRYTDSIHLAVVEALAAAGATTADLIGVNAKPWTFAAQGEDLRGERSLLRYLTISTSDPHLSSILEKIDTARIASSSNNGDKIDCAGASLSFMTAQGLPIDNALTVNFASPFVVSKKKETKSATEHLNSLKDADLSAAFSAGLSSTDRSRRQTSRDRRSIVACDLWGCAAARERQEGGKPNCLLSRLPASHDARRP